jgi:hypothetical protein
MAHLRIGAHQYWLPKATRFVSHAPYSWVRFQEDVEGPTIPRRTCPRDHNFEGGRGLLTTLCTKRSTKDTITVVMWVEIPRLGIELIIIIILLIEKDSLD